MAQVNEEIGARALRRLEEELVVWLTTITPGGAPQPTPVWFLWNGGEFLIYSQPKALKLRNIRSNSRVTLNLNTDPYGGDVLVVYGEARIDADAPLSSEVQAYVDKYRGQIKNLDMTPESFARSYSVAIRVKPEQVRSEEA
jgi:PPOX class probable F420-dependent enzyme